MYLKYGHPQNLEGAIQSHLQDEFEIALFEAALRNLEDHENKLRFNNFAYAMRELSRHFLHRMAPDKNVLACRWYKNETKNENGITRRQRAYYAVQGGLSDEYVRRELCLDVDSIHDNLIKSINDLSKFTHIEKGVFSLPNDEVAKRVHSTLYATAEFFDLIHKFRNDICSGAWYEIDQTIVSTLLEEAVYSLDELATHHYIEEVWTELIKVESIDHESIHLSANGSITCEFQWGSNSDIKNDLGARMTKSIPFSCRLSSPISEPEEISIVDGSLRIDPNPSRNDVLADSLDHE